MEGRFSSGWLEIFIQPIAIGVLRKTHLFLQVFAN
jgi:hypothetical protein